MFGILFWSAPVGPIARIMSSSRPGSGMGRWKVLPGPGKYSRMRIGIPLSRMCPPMSGVSSRLSRASSAWLVGEISAPKGKTFLRTLVRESRLLTGCPFKFPSLRDKTTYKVKALTPTDQALFTHRFDTGTRTWVADRRSSVGTNPFQGSGLFGKGLDLPSGARCVTGVCRPRSYRPWGSGGPPPPVVRLP